MNKYIVSNIADRNHQEIYSGINSGAFFDLEPSQHGWDDFSKIKVGDIVYVINKKRIVSSGYQVTSVSDGILLSEDKVWGSKVDANIGGETRVVFGKSVEQVDIEYSMFVINNNITSPKINPLSGKMYPGFNCASF